MTRIIKVTACLAIFCVVSVIFGCQDKPPSNEEVVKAIMTTVTLQGFSAGYTSTDVESVQIFEIMDPKEASRVKILKIDADALKQMKKSFGSKTYLVIAHIKAKAMTEMVNAGNFGYPERCYYDNNAGFLVKKDHKGFLTAVMVTSPVFSR